MSDYPIEFKALEEENDKLKRIINTAGGSPPPANLQFTDMLLPLQAENEHLKKYAWHKKDCMLFSIAKHPKCSCGFEQTLKGE